MLNCDQNVENHFTGLRRKIAPSMPGNPNSSGPCDAYVPQ